MVKKINSRNAEFQKFQVLKTNRNKRHKYGEFFVEGVRNINGAVEGGWKITSFLYTREKPLSGWAEDLLQKVPTQVNYQLTAGLMEELSGKTDTSELMAVVRMRPDDLSALAVRAADNNSVFQFIESLRQRYPGFQVLGTTAHKQYPLYGQDLTGPVLLMVGNETQGLCYAFKEGCDKLVTIPMAETSYASSFNVACAATVMLYEVSRQRALNTP